MEYYQPPNSELPEKSWKKAIKIIISVVLLGGLVIYLFAPRGLIVFGTTFYDKGNYETAIIFYNMATWIDPKNPYAYYNRGLAYSSQGKSDLALSDYSRSIEVDPNFSSAYVVVAIFTTCKRIMIWRLLIAPKQSHQARARYRRISIAASHI